MIHVRVTSIDLFFLLQRSKQNNKCYTVNISVIREAAKQNL